MSEIKDLIQHALDQDYNKASAVFGEVMNIKTQEVLDQMKVKLAGQIYNGEEEADEDDDVELAAMSDEEIDAELEGVDDEDEDEESEAEAEDEEDDRT